MGSMGMGRVLYTVPHAGQMGFNYRTERNKRILKVYEKGETANLTKNGGFNNYGVINGAAILLDGSIPGPAKRLVRIKESSGSINTKGIKEPKIIEINR
jgi:large subunit ribosomal protein L3